jgi:hypothetical protein
MLNKHIIDAIESVNSVQAFNALIDKWNLSDADEELKSTAIRELKVKKSKFDTTSLKNHNALLKDIQDGAADISDAS